MSRESSFCYICLNNEMRLVNMNGTGSNKVKLLDMLIYLSFETSCIEDNIPMYICDGCCKHLRLAYDLKVMCQQNNIHVRRYIFYLKQFTHPTSFTNAPEIRNNSVQKQKPLENTKKKSHTDEVITIQMDLTDIGDESDVEICEIDAEQSSQNKQNTVANEVVKEQCEMSNTSILSERPEFNNTFKHSQLFKINSKSQIGCMKIIKSNVSDTKLSNKIDSSNKVSTTSSQTKILSNRPEFNLYKNVNSQNDTKIKSNNKETSALTEQNISDVNSKTKSNTIPANDVTSFENKKNKESKRRKEKELDKTTDKKFVKPVTKLKETKNENRTNVESAMRPEFVEFDIISTVKLRKRGVVSVKPSQPVNNQTVKKRKVQKMTYHVRKDKKIIQRMNKCRVVLQRCQIVKKESPYSENKTNTEETNHVINKIVQNDIVSNNESITIKEESNKLENQHCTTLQDNTNTTINNTSQEQSLAIENILIKQEIFDDGTNFSDIKKSPIENDEFSFKIEIVDDSSNNSVTCYGTDKIIKFETVGNDTKNTATCVTNTESGINNSVFSFSNAELLTTCEHDAELLTTCEQSVSVADDLTKSITNKNDTEAISGQGNCRTIVGNVRLTKSTDKPVKEIDVMFSDSMNTTCDSIDSDVSGELIIDEDTPSSEKPVNKTASSVKQPAVLKILSPECGRKNLLNVPSNQTVSNTEQGHLFAKEITGTVGNTAVDQATVVPELKNDLSTVHLPNYKFPVSKRLLNFSSKEQPVDYSVQTSSQIPHELNKLSTNVSKLNCKSALRKTTGIKPTSHLRVAQLHSEHTKVFKTINTPASVETKVNKPTSTSRKLPKKVGNPVIIGTNIGEESPITLKAKQIQLMMKYMGQETEVGINRTTPKEKNTCLTSIGNTELSEGTASRLMPVGSSNQAELFTAWSNGTSDIPSASLAHLNGCNNAGSCKCLQNSVPHFQANGLSAIENGAEFAQPEYQYKLPQQTDQRRMSNQDWSLKCPICNKHFGTTLKLKKHALIHKNFYHCPICTEKFPKKSQFKVHMLVHEESKHKCLMCDKRTLTNRALVQHYKTEHKSTKVCCKCKLIFKTDTDHTKHMERHCAKRTCTICNQCVTTKTYKAHMKSHERSKCSLCDKYFDMKQLNEHNCTEQWEKTYKCTECDRTFYFQPSLEKHLKMHYEMQCFICKTTFCKPHAIVEHMSRHIGPNGYRCPICDLCTFSKDNMKLHMTDHNEQTNKFTAQMNTKCL